MQHFPGPIVWASDKSLALAGNPIKSILNLISSTLLPRKIAREGDAVHCDAFDECMSVERNINQSNRYRSKDLRLNI